MPFVKSDNRMVSPNGFTFPQKITMQCMYVNNKKDFFKKEQKAKNCIFLLGIKSQK